MPCAARSLCSYFNPRSHERSDGIRSCSVRLQCDYFNPRSHERSDIKGLSKALGRSEFQSTLPREERPFHARSVRWSLPISIHAPTRGATRACCLLSLVYGISIHAPTRGATSLCLNCGIKKEFQSTLPREERRGVNI